MCLRQVLILNFGGNSCERENNTMTYRPCRPQDASKIFTGVMAITAVTDSTRIAIASATTILVLVEGVVTGIIDIPNTVFGQRRALRVQDTCLESNDQSKWRRGKRWSDCEAGHPWQTHKHTHIPQPETRLHPPKTCPVPDSIHSCVAPGVAAVLLHPVVEELLVSAVAEELVQHIVIVGGPDLDNYLNVNVADVEAVELLGPAVCETVGAVVCDEAGHGFRGRVQCQGVWRCGKGIEGIFSEVELLRLVHADVHVRRILDKPVDDLLIGLLVKIECLLWLKQHRRKTKADAIWQEGWWVKYKNKVMPDR